MVSMASTDVPETHFWLIALLIIFGVLAADGALNSAEPTNNEPFTGLCDRPTTQGGC